LKFTQNVWQKFYEGAFFGLFGTLFLTHLHVAGFLCLFALQGLGDFCCSSFLGVFHLSAAIIALTKFLT